MPDDDEGLEEGYNMEDGEALAEEVTDHLESAPDENNDFVSNMDGGFPS